MILKTSKRGRESIKVYGNDYPTADGTCIRDYIHMEDVADAHLLALLSPRRRQDDVFNCGYGHGYSVRQVLDEAKRVMGIDFVVQDDERRTGDPPVLVADSAKMKQKLGWKPKYDSLEYIVKTAWHWEKKQ